VSTIPPNDTPAPKGSAIEVVVNAVTTPTPTVTHYQELADNFIKALDDIVQSIPNLQIGHPTTVNFVRSHLNVPQAFLATAIAVVEGAPELQAVNKLDVVAARDALQFIDAFRAVLDRVTAFQESLRFTIFSKQAGLAADSLQIYDIAKGMARDPGGAAIGVHVGNLKRDLGRRGRPRLKTPPAQQTPAPTTPASPAAAGGKGGNAA